MTARLAGFVEAHGRGLVLVALSFALAGVVFLFQLPIAIFPQTDFPRIVILVDNGIAPVDVQLVTVTRRIEEAIRLVPGITDVRSVTARGSTEISVFFRWDVDILNALHLVQGRIAQIMPTLPPEARFYINRLTFSVFPMIGFSITSRCAEHRRVCGTLPTTTSRPGFTACRAWPRRASSAAGRRSTTSSWIRRSSTLTGCRSRRSWMRFAPATPSPPPEWFRRTTTCTWPR